MRTCTCWRDEWQSLSATRFEHGPMANRAACDHKLLKDYPRWATEAFVDVLARAASWDLDISLGSQRKGLQAAAAKVIAISRFPADLASEITPRLHRFHYLTDQIRITFGVVKNMAPSVGWALIKTWLNSWVTASRVGACPRRCKFGCPSSANNMDRLNHYVDCNTIWDVLLTVLWKLHAMTWTTSRWKLLVVRPPFLHGEFNYQQKLYALAAVVDCFQYVSNQKVVLDRFTNPGVSSSEEGPSETGTDVASDSEGEVSSGQDMLEITNDVGT